MKYRLSGKGFTLLEMMLVLVIAASLMAMFINFSTQQYHQQQRDKAVMQAQQILNAALSFYNQKGRWPALNSNPNPDTWVPVNAYNELITGGYLAIGTGPNSTWMNPYNGGVFNAGFSSTTNIFYVMVYMQPIAGENLDSSARVIAAQLPSGAVSSSPGSSFPPSVGSHCVVNGNCTVIASVPPPGQNLNNARSVNFGSLYSSGQCVPTPACPTGMSPQIFVVPASVNGLSDMTNQASPNVYPISSYTAYAIGPFAGSASSSNPCTGSGGVIDDCSKVQGGYNNQYWRVCLSVTTQKGLAAVPTTSDHKIDTINLGSLIAVTRCVPGNPPTEKTGSGFQVYQ